MDSIVKDLQTFSPDELNEIHRVIKAYRFSLQNKRVDKDNLHYFGRFLAIDWDENDRPFMELGPNNENTYGVAQGGALYTFADIAIGMKILEKLQEGEKVFTLEMKMNFIKMGTGDKLFAKPEFLHVGNTTIVAQCQIYDNVGETVAHALGTFYKVSKDNKK